MRLVAESKPATLSTQQNNLSHPPAPFPNGITCLLEDMLVSVLMLLVSVTTIADGNREVWEYWGGSCLCVYTGERERRE